MKRGSCVGGHKIYRVVYENRGIIVLVLDRCLSFRILRIVDMRDFGWLLVVGGLLSASAVHCACSSLESYRTGLSLRCS